MKCAGKSLSLSVIADVDECELGTDLCNGNAFCTNNIGLYQCSCLQGYQGDGYDCRGEEMTVVLESKYLFFVHHLKERK